ncbi:MAG TPA: hypothetical protein VMT96_00275 [Candidatus Bathyarchaeia archaeon]|nr:hypothetical protein [Candidatus Bathyarchaeia archaeon]
MAALSIIRAPAAMAYYCDQADLSHAYAYNNGQEFANGTGLNPVQLQYLKDNPQNLTYSNGSCQANMIDTSQGNKNDNATKDGHGNIVTCGSGNVKGSDGNCYATKTFELGGMPPRYDNGQQISQDDLKNIYNCTNGGTYDAGDNTCTKGAFCTAWPWGQSCVDHSTYTPQQAKVDPKTGEVTQCTNAGATFNTQTHQCNWTQQTCGAAQGQWDAVGNKCNNLPAPNAQQQQQQQQNCAPTDQSANCTAAGPGGDAPTVDGSCGQAKTNIISCDSGSCKTTGSDGKFTGAAVLGCVLKFGVSALTVLVGIGAVAGIVWEAIQYARAQDDQSVVSKARNRIRDIVIGLVVYIFMVAVINWLIPGGIIK